MTTLFKRAVAVTVGVGGEGLRVTGLRVTFKISKTARPEPNACEVTITNLSADHRQKMTLQDGVPVVLEAGYEGDLKQIFRGDMLLGKHARQGTDWVTNLHAGDGAKATRTSKITESFEAGAKKKAVAKRLLETMKINVKDAIAKVNSVNLAAGAEQFAKGVSLDGQTANELSGVLAGMGLTWSIQDGAAQVLEKGKSNGGKAVVLSPSTGMVGSPEAGEKGYVKVRSLLNALIVPGGSVVLDSQAFKGTFVVEKVEHHGDTHGSDWYTDAEVLPS